MCLKKKKLRSNAEKLEVDLCWKTAQADFIILKEN